MREARRLFIKGSAAYALLCAAAFGLGCSVPQQQPAASGERKPKIAIIYASRYGAAADTAGWIAKGMDQQVDLFDIATMDPQKVISSYDGFVIGSGIWLGSVDKRLVAFMETYAAKLDKRIPATFIVCDAEPTTASGEQRIAGYFAQLHAPLKHPPVFHRAMGGRVAVEKLKEEDKTALEAFYRNDLGSELNDWDRTSPKLAYRYGKEISARIKEGCAKG